VGKSYLLNYLIQGLRQKYNDGETEDPTTTPTVVVAAATGYPRHTSMVLLYIHGRVFNWV
jgi:hypothetical protein